MPVLLVLLPLALALVLVVVVVRSVVLLVLVLVLPITLGISLHCLRQAWVRRRHLAHGTFNLPQPRVAQVRTRFVRCLASSVCDVCCLLFLHRVSVCCPCAWPPRRDVCMRFVVRCRRIIQDNCLTPVR